MRADPETRRSRRPDWRWFLAALLAGAVVAGVLLGEARQTFAFAWPLCLPCIGIQ